MKRLYGLTTAMITPIDEQDHVDLNAVKDLTDFLISKGVHCLYPCGTTGEMYLLSTAERKKIAETVVKQAKGRVTVFIHVGAMTQKETLELAGHAHEIGADGIGVVTPAFFPVTDREMEEYFVAIAKSLPDDFPIYLYNIPQDAVNDLKPAVIEKIVARCRNVIGIKYSFADFLRVKDYLNINNGHFSVVVGTDRLFHAALTMGCDGTVSGVGCVCPEPFIEIYKAYLHKDEMKARQTQKTGCEVAGLLKCGSNTAYFKTGLEFRGVKAGHMRKPLLDLTEEEKAVLKKQLTKFI